MTRREAVITNTLGLHARAAARFVELAGRYAAQVQVSAGSRTVDGKSILGLLLLVAARGTTIIIQADGDQEAAAVEALASLVERGFDEP